MGYWRLRRCPGCGAVRPAGEFALVQYEEPWTPDGRLLRRCPRCGGAAPTHCFRITWEAPRLRRHRSSRTRGRSLSSARAQA
jgi:hypothetical protein